MLSALSTANMITLEDYFMGRDKLFPAELTEEMWGNAVTTIERANLLLERAGLQRGVNSGWRPASVNAAVRNAAKRSKHIHCLAIDIDDDGAVRNRGNHRSGRLNERHVCAYLQCRVATPGRRRKFCRACQRHANDASSAQARDMTLLFAESE